MVAAIAVGAALPVGGWALLQTERARTALRDRVVETVESSIRGDLEIRSVRVEPSLAVRIDGVRLLAPDGAVAATAESIHVRFDASSIWMRRPMLVIAAARPDVDLTPAPDGTTALSRALEPDAPRENADGSRLSLVVSLRDGRLLRGAPPGSPQDSAVVRAERVSLDGKVELLPGGVRATLSAAAHLRAPHDESVRLHARLDTTGGATVLDDVRVSAGRSRARGSSIRMETAEGGGFAIPDGIVRATLRAVDLTRWTGRPVPGDLHVEATSANGTVVATAGVAGAGSLFAVGHEHDNGTWSGSIIAREVAPSAWGLDAVQGNASAVASFAARPADRAWGIHLRTSPIAWRGATFEPAVATAHGRGSGEIVATVWKFAVTQDGRTWTLARPATIARRPGRIDVREIALEGPGGQTIMADGTWPPTKPQPLAIRTHALELDALPRAFLPAGVRPRGRLDLVARLDAPPRAGDAIPDGRVSLRLRHGHVGIAAAAPYLPRGDLDVVANAILGERRARLTVDARASSGETLRGTADAPLRLPRDSDHASLDLRAGGFTLGGLPELGGRVQAGIAHRRAWFLASARSGEREIVRAGGSGTAAIDALLRDKRLPAFAAWVERVDGAALSAAGLLPEGVAGTLRGGITSDGSASFAALTADGVRWSSWIDASLHATARTSGPLALASLRITTGREETGIRDNGSIGITAHLDQRPAAALATGTHRFAIRGAFRDVHLAEAVAKKVPEAMRTAPDADGRIDGAIALDGASGETPSGWACLAAHHLVVEGAEAGRIDAFAHLGDGGVAAAVSAQGPEGGRLAALARLGPWGTAPLLQAPFIAVAAADDFDLASLAGFLREHATGLAGTLRVRAVAGGTLGSPAPRGRLELRNGAVRTRDIGRLHGIALAATLEPDELVIEELRVQGPRGGPLVAEGRAVRGRGPEGESLRLKAQRRTRTDPAGWRIGAHARARNFTVEGERFGGSFDGNARMTGRLDEPILVARLDLDAGTIRLPDIPEKRYQSLDAHPDFAIVTAQSERVLVAGREAAKPALRTKLHLVAPGNLRVTGRDVDLLLSANVKLDTGAEEGTSFAGEVLALRGNAAVAGKKFTIERARIGFPGAPLGKARLDILADHRVDAHGPDDDATTIHARVGGTVEDPLVAFTSDPPMPEDAVVSMLFLGAAGRPRDPAAADDGPSLTGRAATLLGNYLTTKLRDQVQEVVPVDVLELETGGSGSSEGRLRVGKYLAPGLFLSYARSFGAAEDEGVNNVRLEWRLRRRWQVVSEIVDGNRGDVDLVWTREF